MADPALMRIGLNIVMPHDIHPFSSTIDIRTVARSVNALLAEYVRVHDNIYGVSFARSLRRLLPIPGLFEAIPYAAHADTLQRLRDGLITAALQAKILRPQLPLGSARLEFLDRLEHYLEALDLTVSLLQRICIELAAKAETRPGPTWSHYRERVHDYDRACATYIRLGAALNSAYITAEREA
jgi:hypothetical protein